MRVQLLVTVKPNFSEADFAFVRYIFTVKHEKPIMLYWAWRAFVTLLQVC